jgi:hypothetical protein
MVSDEDPDPRATSGGFPELRASDQDRDEALRLLAGAAGDGRLTLEEYSERADAALGARTRGELERVTGDLQDARSDLPAEAPQEMTAILSNQTRTGRWRVPACACLGASSSEATCPRWRATRFRAHRSSTCGRGRCWAT